MSDPAPGRLIAAGRAADVYELDDDWVLRRYRLPIPVEREAEIMTYARAHGYPVPAVREASGTDLVTERLRGPTMLEEMARRPLRFLEHARTLAALHRQLHAIPAPAGLWSPFDEGDCLIHRDLHPLNVILTEGGPVVIDWSSALRGTEAHDVCETWILLAVGEPPGSAIEQLVIGLGRRMFLRAFLSGFDLEAAAMALPAVAELRLKDRNMSEAERAGIKRLVKRVRGRSAF